MEENKTTEQKLLDYLRPLESTDVMTIMVGAGMEEALTEAVKAELDRLGIEIVDEEVNSVMQERHILTRPTIPESLKGDWVPPMPEMYEPHGGFPRKGKGSWNNPNKFHN